MLRTSHLSLITSIRLA